MHELGLAQEIVEVAQRAAERAGATRVERVQVTVGRLMQVEVDSLLFLLSVVRQDYPLMARTSFRAVVEPAQARCRACGRTWQIEDWVFLCGACGSGDLEVLSGECLEVTDMEVEVGDEA